MLIIVEIQFSDLYLAKVFFSFKHDGQVSRIDSPLQQEVTKLFDRVMTEYLAVNPYSVQSQWHHGLRHATLHNW